MKRTLSSVIILYWSLTSLCKIVPNYALLGHPFMGSLWGIDIGGGTVQVGLTYMRTKASGCRTHVDRRVVV